MLLQWAPCVIGKLDAITKYTSLSNSPEVLQSSPITSNFKLVIFHISLGLVGGRIGQAKTIGFGSTLCCTCRLLSYVDIGWASTHSLLAYSDFYLWSDKCNSSCLKSIFSLALSSGFYCKDSGGVSEC